MQEDQKNKKRKDYNSCLNSYPREVIIIFFQEKKQHKIKHLYNFKLYTDKKSSVDKSLFFFP